ncbi:MAG: prepilin-type N-terminal cleavage/methylation domain-containing protein [Polyangiales bacterium]
MAMNAAVHKRAGFTLVELMIAMIAGAFAVAGVYYLNGVSARSYAQQMAVSDAQMSLRSAMEQLRRDVARAGYLAAPSTALLRTCDGALAGNGATVNTSHQFQALAVGTSALGGSLRYNPDVNGSNGTQVAALLGGNRVASDDLTMFGNFATPDAYLADSHASTASVITLQADREAFRRSFFTPSANNAPAVSAPAEFENVFRPGRMLRVEVGGHFFFRQISARQWVPPGVPTITLATALPTCAENTQWMAVAPVSRIHYGLESDLTADFSRLRGDASLPGSRRAMLVRREETTNSLPPPAAPQIATGGFSGSVIAIPNSARVVLDYAVEFGISAVRNTNTVVGGRPVWQHAITPAEMEALNRSPGDFRSLIVTISSRASEVDPRLGPVGGTRRMPATNILGDPLLTFNVIDPNFSALTTLQARVRTMRSEIFLHNL